jgi:hypothetical protein
MKRKSCFLPAFVWRAPSPHTLDCGRLTRLAYRNGLFSVCFTPHGPDASSGRWENITDCVSLADVLLWLALAKAQRQPVPYERAVLQRLTDKYDGVVRNDAGPPALRFKVVTTQIWEAPVVMKGIREPHMLWKFIAIENTHRLVLGAIKPAGTLHWCAVHQALDKAESLIWYRLCQAANASSGRSPLTNLYPLWRVLQAAREVSVQQKAQIMTFNPSIPR